MKKNPKVSVIITTCNRPELIGRAINSVLNQTFQDFEIIVVDDGVKMRVEDEVRKIKDDRIVYVKHEHNKGAPAARNTGIDLARGEYTAFLDDDDEWLTEKLNKQVDIFNRYGNKVGLVSCSLIIKDKNNFKKKKHLPVKGLCKPLDELLRKGFIWTSTMMVRSKILKEQERFDEKLKKNQEWDLTIRLSQITTFYIIDEILVVLHLLDEDKHLGGEKNIGNLIIGLKTFIEKHTELYKERPSYLAFRYYQLGELYRKNKQFKLAIQKLIKALILNFGFFYIKHLIIFIADMNKNLVVNLYKKLKHVPLLGGTLVYIRNIPRLDIVVDYKYKKLAQKKIVELIINFFGTDGLKYLEEFKKTNLNKLEFSHGYSSDFNFQVLYIITRVTRPLKVVETGVASGRSSTSLLHALNENNKGHLFSIDLPKYFVEKPEYYITEEGNREIKGFVPVDKSPGWLVPNYLRYRWTLQLGDSRVELPLLLDKLNEVDIFYHDSDHGYENMLFEFNTVWPKIKKGGYLISDDIRWNKSYEDFKKSVEYSDSFEYRGFGIIKK